jgi:hypothetical protein
MLSTTLGGCALPRCWKRNQDVSNAIPTKVSALARDELDCRDPIDVRASPVPFGGGWMATGCLRTVVYTCSCGESKTIDECNSECTSPSCEVYGCAEQTVLMSFGRDKCVWRK